MSNNVFKPYCFITLSLAAVISLSACSSGKRTTAGTRPVSQNQSAAKLDGYDRTKLDAIFMDAEKARMLDDNTKALRLYQEYLKMDPTNATVQYNIGRILLEQNSYSQALPYAEKAAQLEPGNKWFNEMYADALTVNNQYLKAADVYGKLVKQFPQEEEYLYKRALVQMRGNDTNGALQTINDLEKLTGVQDELIFQKQAIYLKMGKVDLAAKEIQKLIDQNPGDVKYLGMLAEMYEANNMTEKADSTYALIMKNQADNPQAMLIMAQYYKRKKDEVKYRELMGQLISSKEVDEDTKIAMIVPILQESGRDSLARQSAVNLARSFYQSDTASVKAMALYADVLYMNNQAKEALPLYYRTLKVDNSKFGTWQQIMFIYAQEMNNDSLIAVTERAMVYYPNQAISYYFNGSAYNQKKNYAAAQKALSKGLALEGENKELNADMYAMLADVYHNNKNYAASDSCFDKSLALIPDNASTLNNYAYYLSLRNKDLDKALKMSKKSLELRPDEKSFLDTYGWILYKQGKYSEAKTYIEKAIESAGDDDATLLEHLGDVMYKLNEPEKALEYWKQAKQKNVDTPFIDKKIAEKKLYE